SVAKMAEELEDGAEPATYLIEAAGRMERAIVYLRQNKLTDAYEPPMKEALASLEKAKGVIDQQKQEADEQQEQQQRDALRQRYEKLREEQLVVNQTTTKLDNSRDAEGNLPRHLRLEVVNQSGIQAELSGKTTEIEKDLSAMKSIVFTWANQDIVKSMDQVKEDLAKGETAVPTRSEQELIVAQLDAMIENLKESPKKPEPFEDRASGGGGG